MFKKYIDSPNTDNCFCQRYRSFLVDDDCIAIISIFFSFCKGGGDDTFLKSGGGKKEYGGIRTPRNL